MSPRTRAANLHHSRDTTMAASYTIPWAVTVTPKGKKLLRRAT